MPMEMPFFFPGMAMVAVGAAVFVMWMMFRSQSRREFSSRGEIEHLNDAIEELRVEFDALRGELTEVHERLDFAERVLTAGRASEEGQK